MSLRILARIAVEEVPEPEGEEEARADLEPEDRIVLRLSTESAGLRQAIDVHRSYIAGETLAVELAGAPFDGAAHRAAVKVEGQALEIELAKWRQTK